MSLEEQTTQWEGGGLTYRGEVRPLPQDKIAEACVLMGIGEGYFSKAKKLLGVKHFVVRGLFYQGGINDALILDAVPCAEDTCLTAALGGFNIFPGVLQAYRMEEGGVYIMNWDKTQAILSDHWIAESPYNKERKSRGIHRVYEDVTDTRDEEMAWALARKAELQTLHHFVQRTYLL